MIESQDKPKLKLIVPGFKQQDVPAGVELVTEKKRPEEIAHLLQQAMGFVFPSTHETFGLPIIEAMACGCPVITSNTTACKEIGGDAAILVNPKSVIDIKDAMTKLIGDKSLREKMSRDSLRRAADFSWQKSGAEHLEVFKLVLAENPGLSKS